MGAEGLRGLRGVGASPRGRVEGAAALAAAALGAKFGAELAGGAALRRACAGSSRGARLGGLIPGARTTPLALAPPEGGALSDGYVPLGFERLSAAVRRGRHVAEGSPSCRDSRRCGGERFRRAVPVGLVPRTVPLARGVLLALTPAQAGAGRGFGRRGRGGRPTGARRPNTLPIPLVRAYASERLAVPVLAIVARHVGPAVGALSTACAPWLDETNARLGRGRRRRSRLRRDTLPIPLVRAYAFELFAIPRLAPRTGTV